MQDPYASGGMRPAELFAEPKLPSGADADTAYRSALLGPEPESEKAISAETSAMNKVFSSF